MTDSLNDGTENFAQIIFKRQKAVKNNCNYLHIMIYCVNKFELIIQIFCLIIAKRAKNCTTPCKNNTNGLEYFLWP